jgi:transposase InsO family protein
VSRTRCRRQKAERMTDNGSAYRSRHWRQACNGLALRHIRTTPSTPRTNGKAERFIQTSLREWAHARSYATSHERTPPRCSLGSTTTTTRHPPVPAGIPRSTAHTVPQS